jgi:tetratricopeptide (TPR) repeat protein
MGDPSGAIADFDRAIERHPRYAEAYNNRGAARQATGDLAGAVADFDRALGLLNGPAAASVHENRAAARYALGDYRGAVADYDEVLRLIPREAAAIACHGRGGARHAAGDFVGAIADYNQALELDPGLCAAYLSRGHARYHRRDPLATSDYRMAFRLDRRLAAAEIVRVLIRDLRGDAGAVLENCRKHIRINPGDIVAHARRGLTLLLQGRDAEAEPDFQQVLRLGPAWAGPLHLLIDEAARRRAS